jgi:hypothetical protein
MNKKLGLVAIIAAFGIGGGTFAYFQFAGGTTPAGYTDTNVNMGDVALPTTDCGEAPSHDRLVCLADLLKAGLSPELLAELQRPYTVAEAKLWSNFPPMGFQDRVGPTLGDFTSEQHGLIKAILQNAASLAANEGYDELEQVLNADDYLLAETGEAGFSSSNYHIAFLGTPAATGTWQLYFGGHHFALSNTYRDGQMIGATPSFRGVEPFTPFTMNGRENAPMVQEQAAFAAALGALTDADATKATLAGTYTNIIAGPQQDDAIPTAQEGLKLGETSPAVQALVMAAIETYVRDVNEAGADEILARYRAELGDTFLGFAGSRAVDAENDYVRIDGPSVWIEFSLQPSRSLAGIHPHSVWRDKTADYGGNGE